MPSRTCSYRNKSGEPCGAPPLKDSDFCFWHSPAHAEEAAEARRLGRLRGLNEKITSGAYDFENVESVTEVRRILEMAVLDTLGLENSVGRSRTLAYLAQVALKALDVGELEERMAALEESLRPRLQNGRKRR